MVVARVWGAGKTQSCCSVSIILLTQDEKVLESVVRHRAQHIVNNSVLYA